MPTPNAVKRVQAVDAWKSEAMQLRKKVAELEAQIKALTLPKAGE